jgi:hypothetical protein
MQQSFSTYAMKTLFLMVASTQALYLNAYAEDQTPPPAASHARAPFPKPAVQVFPDSVVTPLGGQVKLTARPTGGEAILFSVDWSVAEGTQGGYIESGSRNKQGELEAIYFAPRSGSGPFHIVAKLHEYPAATAEVVVEIKQ